MYDTVVASIEWPHRLDEKLFDGGRMISDLRGSSVTRWWLNPKQGYAPRVTYWRRLGEGGGRLQIEFSIPKLAFVDLLDNVTEDDKRHALSVATMFVRAQLDDRLPDVGNWRVSRVDYAWNWDVGAELPAYLAVLGRLWLSDYTRHPFPETQGVIWKSKRDHVRWVKFYDKSREAGGGDSRRVLRFEVSNYKRVLPYVCAKWFGCEQTVDAVLQPGRALYVMARMWERLGLGRVDAYASQDALMVRLRGEFGRAASGAYYALRCIEDYGADAHKSMGLMSSNSYYAWRRRLAQYLVHHEHTLMRLHLPASVVFEQAKSLNDVQNLEDLGPRPARKDKKFLWEKIALNLRLTRAKPSEYLIARWREYASASAA